MHDPVRPITALLLAGGRAMRMDGADKGLQLLHGEALALHVLRRLTPHVSQTIISANRNLDAYGALGATFGARIVTDDDPPGTFAGPLAGLLAGLRAAGTPLLLCAPCDVPFVPLDLVQRLGAAHAAAEAEIAYAVTLDQHGARREHPLCALLNRSLADDLAAALAAGERKVRTWYGRHRTVEVVFSEERAFYNVNALQDLAALDRS
jgi:molybdenum cofactor guanylyltransferase